MVYTILRVLYEHIKKLCKVVTPTHNLLKIPPRYLSEAPWPYAQQQISCVDACKTPKDKVKCIVR